MFLLLSNYTMKIGKFKYLFMELQKKIFRNYKRPEDMQRFK